MNALDESGDSSRWNKVSFPRASADTDRPRLWQNSDTYSVVGIRSDGRRDVVWKHVSRSLAERVRRMLQETYRYEDISLEPESGESTATAPTNRRAS